MMIKKFDEFVILESKQIGIIYHYTTVNGLVDLMEQRMDFFLRSAKKYISFSRNYNMLSPELRVDKRAVRIVIDGNKLSHRYKIEPYKDPLYDKTKSEWEERIITDEGVNIKNCIIQIDVKKTPPFMEENTDKYTRTYQFGINDYVSEYDQIKNRYEQYLEKIDLLKGKFDFPILFVDKFTLYK